MKETNFDKGVGVDEFDGQLLLEKDIKLTVKTFILKTLNLNQVPDYLKISKLILLSKSKSSETTMDNTRPIMVNSHLTKIIEKTIKNKLDELKS